MASYQNTGEFYALKLPHIDREYVEALNEEMERMQGTGKVEALFNNFKCVSLDSIKRRLFSKKK